MSVPQPGRMPRCTHADLQRDALSAAGCWRVFTDHVSGVREQRPELDRVLEALRPGDTLVVWRLDRLGRSLRHLIDVATDLATEPERAVPDREHRGRHAAPRGVAQQV